MYDAESVLLHAYERAVSRQEALDKELFQEFTAAFDADSPGPLILRRFAFLEGLRRQRDDAWHEKQRAEAALVDHLASKLGIPPDVAT